MVDVISTHSDVSSPEGIVQVEPPRIRLVCATRESQEDFYSKTVLGKLLSVNQQYKSVEVRLFANNKTGLPVVYNQALNEAVDHPTVLIFIHDDVFLNLSDSWVDQILAGLQVFDIVGNRRRVENQPSWCFTDMKWTWDDKYLSGTVANGKGSDPDSLSFFGVSGQEVKLLDGMLLAVHSETLRRNHIRFDEIFDFHFYDLDLCRQLEAKHLRMGTWPISIAHESGGTFGGETWEVAFAKYLAKWGS